jgi:beta-lactamase superfamily II metal-dependent hydrolase
MKIKFYLISIIVLFFGSCSKDGPYTLAIKSFPHRTNDFTLWQLEQFNGISQMGYILRTDDNKVIVVDGGYKESSTLVNDYIVQLGGTVHYWILTHPHKDHAGVLNQVLSNTSNIQIQSIVHTRIDLEVIKKHETGSYEYVKDFYSVLYTSGVPLLDVTNGENIDLGEGVVMKVLGVRNPGIVANLVNNSSLVFQIASKSKTVLFTGDLGVEGGDKVLINNDLSTLRSTHVQMAHHGQDGVSKDFYAAVNAEIALWPTPRWLWENDLDAKGFNTGPWKTLIVKNWMNDLNIAQNIVAGLEGTSQID